MPISAPSIFGMLNDWANNDYWPIINSGPPTSGGAGTGNGLAGKGSICIDVLNGEWYQNTGTKASPTWTRMLKRSDSDAGALFVTGLFANTDSTGIGYSAGAGGAVTQITSKSTAVSLTKITGQITMHNANLAAGTTVSFTVNNNAILATDVVIVNIKSGATANSYRVGVDAVANNSFVISLRNESGGALAEAIVLNFAIIRAVNA